jgi:hypothetical protein
MANIIPFANGGKLPAYLKNSKALMAVNADVATGSSFPVLSIKGKVFTLIKGSEKKRITRMVDGEEEAASSTQLVAVRANTKARVFYANAYSEDSSEGARPTCYSSDGVAPAADSLEMQAKKCQLCPHAVWGSKKSAPGQEAKGTACSVNTRIAVIDPNADNETAYLLRVPAGSRGNFAKACEMGDTRGLPYNAMVLKVSFDPEAPSPRLEFKPIGLVSDEVYDKVQALYESEEVKQMLGYKARPAADDHDDTPALPAPAAAPAEDDWAVSAAEVEKALSKASAPAPAPKATKPAKTAPAPVVEDDEPEPAPAPVTTKKAAVDDTGMDDLLSSMDDLLSQTDD